MRNKKVLLSAALVVSAVSSALAQGNGLAGINDATNMVTSYSTRARSSSTPSEPWSG